MLYGIYVNGKVVYFSRDSRRAGLIARGVKGTLKRLRDSAVPAELMEKINKKLQQQQPDLTTPRPKPKGLLTWHRKRQKNFIKAVRTKENQKDLCRFIKMSFPTFTKHGRKNVFKARMHTNGLQVRNRVYLLNGKYKLINSQGARIEKVFDSVPTWANDDLKEHYHKELVKRADRRGEE